jgi:hypothetical protein
MMPTTVKINHFDIRQATTKALRFADNQVKRPVLVAAKQTHFRCSKVELPAVVPFFGMAFWRR